MPGTISYSSLHTFTCPYSFFLRYTGYVRVKPSEFLALGNAVHYALEQEHSANEWDISHAIELFRKEFRRIIDEDEVFINFAKMKKLEADGVAMLEQYDSDVDHEIVSAHPFAVELEFAIPYEGTKVVGRIDNLDQDAEGEFIVTDYKTGTRQPDQWFLDHNPQFTCYAWAVLHLYGKLPKKLVWAQLRSGKRLETTRTFEDIEELKEMLSNALTMQRLGMKHRIFHEKVCEQCDYSGGWGKSDICSDKALEQKILERANR